MRIIIAGSREFSNYSFLKSKVLETITKQNHNPKNYEIISGHARGADMLGEKLAKEMGYSLTIMSANWDKYGKSAGCIRNKEMAKYASEDNDCSILIAFGDGKSKGTKNMINIGEKILDRVVIFDYRE